MDKVTKFLHFKNLMLTNPRTKVLDGFEVMFDNIVADNIT